MENIVGDHGHEFDEKHISFVDGLLVSVLPPVDFILKVPGYWEGFLLGEVLNNGIAQEVN